MTDQAKIEAIIAEHLHPEASEEVSVEACANTILAALQPAPSVDLKIEAQEVPAPGDTTSSAAQDGPASSAALSSQEIDVDAATGCADDLVWKGVDLSSVNLEQAAIALKTSREAPGSIIAPENSLRARSLATWALFYGDKLIAAARAVKASDKPYQRI